MISLTSNGLIINLNNDTFDRTYSEVELAFLLKLPCLIKLNETYTKIVSMSDTQYAFTDENGITYKATRAYEYPIRQ